MRRRRLRSLAMATVLAMLAPMLGLAGAEAPASAATPVCAHPVFATSRTYGTWRHGATTVSNDMWNAAGSHMTQRLRVCSAARWTVNVTVPATGDTSVKTYPNANRNFRTASGHEPLLSSFRTLRTSWAARTPTMGTYDAAYDIWFDGVPGRYEVMIWTHNNGQGPKGGVVGSMTFGGVRWQVWSTSDHSYTAFVPERPYDHGTLPLLTPLHALARHGWLGTHPTLGQVAFGFEVVSTAGRQLHFATTAFSVTARR